MKRILLFPMILCLALLSTSCGNEPAGEGRSVTEGETAPEGDNNKENYPTSAETPEELVNILIRYSLHAEDNASSLTRFCNPATESHPAGSVCNPSSKADWTGTMAKAEIDGQPVMNGNMAEVPIRVGDADKYTVTVSRFNDEWYLSDIKRYETKTGQQ